MTEIAGDMSLNLEGSLTIRDAADLKTRLANKLEGDDKITIQMGKCVAIDTAIAQLLLVFVQHMEAAHRSVNWAGVSPGLGKVFTRLGMDELLGLVDVGSKKLV